MEMTKKKSSKSKSKKLSKDDKNDDKDENDSNDFKILSKKVLSIQKNNIINITKSFIKNDGVVSLSVY